MLGLKAVAGRTLKRRVACGAVALLLVTLPGLLLGCPGELDDPDRFKTDAGAGGGSSTSSGTGGSTSSSSSSTTSGTAGGGGSSSGAGGAGGG